MCWIPLGSRCTATVTSTGASSGMPHSARAWARSPGPHWKVVGSMPLKMVTTRSGRRRARSR